MKDVKVDGLSFNVEAVRGMKREAFIAAHLQLGIRHLQLDPEKARQWAGDTYDVLTSRGKKQEVKE